MSNFLERVIVVALHYLKRMKNSDALYGAAKAVFGLCFMAGVRELKDHPALLAWGIGNEVETEATICASGTRSTIFPT